MKAVELIVFGGNTSHTGIAFRKEFQDVEFADTKYTFNQIAELFRKSKKLACLPIWNSHVGEVTVSHAISVMFDKGALLHRIWPCQIIFECLVKKLSRRPKTVISMGVAKDQCSVFIKRCNLIFKDEPKGTPEAYVKFKKSKVYDTVLCPPGMNKDGYKVYFKDAANPLNFTSFVLLATADSKRWKMKNVNDPLVQALSGEGIYSAVQMRIPNSSGLSDMQHRVFNDMFTGARTVSDVAKILFVAKIKKTECRLIVESNAIVFEEKYFNDDDIDEEIHTIPDAGNCLVKYSEGFGDFISKFTGDYNKHDFIRHNGTEFNDTVTCFFACPPLKLITHGFEPKATELVFRAMIAKYIAFMKKDYVSLNVKEKAFLAKYKSKIMDATSEAIKFHVL